MVDDLEFSNIPAAGMRISTQFIGLPELRGVLKKHPQAAVERLQAVVSKRAQGTRASFIEAMEAEYTSVYATGRVANSITYRTLKRPTGVELRFYIKPFRELQFMTSLFGGHFQAFPVTPYEIFPQNDTMRIAIRRDMPGGGRVTLRMMRPGEPVIWGKYTGGFSRDVLREVGEEEEQFFLEDVYGAMKEELKSLRTNIIGGKQT